jgi:hypothetical protein
MSSLGTNSPGHSIERRQFVDKLLSAPVGAVAASIMLAIIMGCMSLSMSIGCKTGPDGTTCQEGKVSVEDGQELDVYYPIPYASPPNLEISGDSESYQIIEQKADHFRIRNQCVNRRYQWNWKARGSKCPPGAAPTVIVTPPSPPPVPPPPGGPPIPLPQPTPVQTP